MSENALLHLGGGSAVMGQGSIRKEGEHIGHGIIPAAAQREELCTDEPGQVGGIEALHLVGFAVKQHLLQGGQGHGVMAGDYGQDLACSADPAKEKKLAS